MTIGRSSLLLSGLLSILSVAGCAEGGEPAAEPASQIVFVSTRDDAARCARELESGEGNRCNTEIYVMDADGGGQRRLTRSPASEWSPKWAPDGTRIAFGRGALGGTFANMVMRADGSQQRQLALPPRSMFLDWSPDGNEIVYVDDGGLGVADIDGGDARRIVTHDESQGFITDAAWSPDGTKIAFERAGGGYGEVGVVWVTNAAGGSKAERLTPADGAAREPAWSPDGKKIAYTCALEATDAVELCVMNADGSDERAITRSGALESAESPTWSPDGKQIAFVVSGSGSTHQVFVIEADGAQQRPLTRNGDNRWPNWQH